MRDKTSEHIAALDGVRGLAVIFVFIYHASSSIEVHNSFASLLQGIASCGGVGVDLFFILSGYLITGILLHAKDVENYYQVFYARRALRILPLYYVVMFGMMSMHWPPIKAQIWFWFNLSNFPTAFNPGLIPYLSHYWSLAIEEQFYLIWPGTVRRLNEKILIRICIGVIITCLVLRNLPIVLAWNQHWPNFIYRLTPFRIDTLCAGALLALLIYRGVNLNRFRAYLRIACIAGATILAASFSAGPSSSLLVRFGYTGAIVCFSALIALALDPASLTAKVFKNRFLRRMGLYSYCFYLIHVGVLSHDSFFQRRLVGLHLAFANEALNRVIAHSIAFAVTFGISALSYKFFESPILGLKKFFPYRKRSLTAVPATASS